MKEFFFRVKENIFLSTYFWESTMSLSRTVFKDEIINFRRIVKLLNRADVDMIYNSRSGSIIIRMIALYDNKLVGEWSKPFICGLELISESRFEIT